MPPVGKHTFAGWVTAVDFVWVVSEQKLKVSCVVVFRVEGTCEPTTEMLSRGHRTNPLTWEDM
jgi:hypothetical protein